LKRLSIGEKMLSKKPSTGFGATGLVGGIPLDGTRERLQFAKTFRIMICMQAE